MDGSKHVTSTCSCSWVMRMYCRVIARGTITTYTSQMHIGIFVRIRNCIPMQWQEVILIAMLCIQHTCTNHLNLYIITIWWRKYDLAESSFTRLVTRFPVDVNLIEFFPSWFLMPVIGHAYALCALPKSLLLSALPFSIRQIVASIYYIPPYNCSTHKSISHSCPFSLSLILRNLLQYFTPPICWLSFSHCAYHLARMWRGHT